MGTSACAMAAFNRLTRREAASCRKTDGSNWFGNNMLLRVRISAFFLAVLLVGTVWFQRQSLRQERAESVRLQSLTLEAPADFVDVDEVERLREETRDLPRLRNEVRQLRGQTNALSILQAEEGRLAAQFARITNATP